MFSLSAVEGRVLIAQIIVVVMLLAFAGTTFLLLGGTTQRAGVLFWVLMPVTLFPLFVSRYLVTHNYYEYLSIDALQQFLMLAYILCATGMFLKIGIAPTHNWKRKFSDWRSRARVVVVLSLGLGLGCLYLISFIPAQITALISDIASGPSYRTGIVEKLELWQGKVIYGGVLTIDGTSYQTPDLVWYYMQSVGRPVRYAYGPTSHFAFSPEHMSLTPLGVGVPFILVGLSLLVIRIGARVFK